MLDEFTFRFGIYLTRADRYSMISSVELRNPFLHTSIIKFALNLLMEFKIKKKISFFNPYSQKYILIKVAKLNEVSNSIINRPKQGTPDQVLFQNLDKIINNQNFFLLSNILKINENQIKNMLLISHL